MLLQRRSVNLQLHFCQKRNPQQRQQQPRTKTLREPLTFCLLANYASANFVAPPFVSLFRLARIQSNIHMAYMHMYSYMYVLCLDHGYNNVYGQSLTAMCIAACFLFSSHCFHFIYPLTQLRKRALCFCVCLSLSLTLPLMHTLSHSHCSCTCYLLRCFGDLRV